MRRLLADAQRLLLRRKSAQRSSAADFGQQGVADDKTARRRSLPGRKPPRARQPRSRLLLDRRRKGGKTHRHVGATEGGRAKNDEQLAGAGRRPFGIEKRGSFGG